MRWFPGGVASRFAVGGINKAVGQDGKLNNLESVPNKGRWLKITGYLKMCKNLVKAVPCKDTGIPRRTMCNRLCPCTLTAHKAGDDGEQRMRYSEELQ